MTPRDRANKILEYLGRDADIESTVLFVESVITAAIEEERERIDTEHEFTLTPREQKMILMCITGKTSDEVAEAIGLSFDRVKQIERRTLRKLEHSVERFAVRNLDS